MVYFLVIILASIITTTATSSNLSRIDKINAAQNSWVAENNEFSNKTLRDMKMLCGALMPNPKNRLPVKEVTISEDIPATFDSRKQWPDCPLIKTIKNQGRCGSCWAVSTTTAAADRICIASNGTMRFNISSQNLMTCCSKCVPVNACLGGYTHEAWGYIKTVGVVTGGGFKSNEGCQPYAVSPNSSNNTLKCYRNCTNQNYEVPYEEDLHFGTNAYTLPFKSVEAMQSEIMKHGPVVSTFTVYKDFFAYKSGVYKSTSNVRVGLHAVRVLGWGTEGGTHYWLAANSWGRRFGMGGFFKILRGTNECNFEHYITAGHAKI